ncbi:hypothetical protein VTG60DRAFT_1226 [Thermothelomyces hinnuleus]
MPISPTIFELQDGCLRLVFPHRPSFQLWNTPTPPSLALCRASPADITRCQNFHAVETDKITGLTFSLAAACSAFTFIASEDPTPWTLTFGLFPTDDAEALFGSMYLSQREIVSFLSVSERSYRARPKALSFGPSSSATSLSVCNGMALSGIAAWVPPLL